MVIHVAIPDESTIELICTVDFLQPRSLWIEKCSLYRYKPKLRFENPLQLSVNMQWRDVWMAVKSENSIRWKKREIP